MASQTLLSLNPMLGHAERGAGRTFLAVNLISWLSSHPSQHLHFTKTIHSCTPLFLLILLLTTHRKLQLETPQTPAATECASPCRPSRPGLQLERKSLPNSLQIVLLCRQKRIHVVEGPREESKGVWQRRPGMRRMNGWGCVRVGSETSSASSHSSCLSVL